MVLATTNLAMLRSTCLVAYTQTVCRGLSAPKRYLLTGAAFPQTPAPGDPRWKAVLKNIEVYNAQPPLFPVDLRREQKIYEMEKSITQIKEILSKIMEKNESIDGRMSHVIELLTKQH